MSETVADFYRRPEKFLPYMEYELSPTPKSFKLNGKLCPREKLLPAFKEIILTTLKQLRLVQEYYDYGEEKFDKRILSEAIREAELVAEAESAVYSDDDILNRFKPVQVLGEDKVFRVFDKVEAKINRAITFDNLREYTPEKIRRSADDWQRKELVDEFFDRTDDRRDWREVVDIDGFQKELLRTNAYRQPRHYQLDSIDPDRIWVFHALVKNLSDNDPETIHVYYSSLKHIVLGRLRCNFVQAGKSGAGKTLFAQTAICLVGKDYATKLNNDFYEKEWNEILRHRLLGVTDETKLADVDAMNRAKSYVDEEESLTVKHKNSSKAERLHCSFILNSNYYRFYFNPDERKFIVPDIGYTNFRDVVDPEEIDRYINRDLLDPQYLAEIVHFLRNYETERTPDQDYKGRIFWQMVRTYGMNVTERFIYNYIVDLELGESVPWRDILNKFKRGYGGKKDYFIDETHLDNVIAKFKQAGRPLAEYFYKEGEIYVKNITLPQHKPQPLNAPKDVEKEWDDDLIDL